MGKRESEEHDADSTVGLDRLTLYNRVKLQNSSEQEDTLTNTNRPSSKSDL